MNDATLERHVDSALENLRREFAGVVLPEEINGIGKGHLEQIRAEARIRNFIPVLVYRSTRETVLRLHPEFLPARRRELHRAA